MSLKEKILKDTFQYTLANYAAMAIGIPVSIATKAILGTVGSGYWALLKVAGAYGEYSDLGTRNAMIREMPQATGAGDEIRRQRIQDNAFSFTLLASFLSAGVIFAISLFIIRDPVLKQAFGVFALLVAATQFYNFLLTLLRASKKVGLLSLMIVGNMGLLAVLSIGGARYKGIVGLVAGTLLATALSTFFACRFGAIRLHLEWDWKEIRRLLGIGFPMVIVSYALVTFLSVDSMMIAKMIGYRELGLYTIALMSVQQISALGRFSQIILIPHIQERFGQTGVLGQTAPYFVRTTHALGHFLPLVVGLVFFLVPVVVHYFLRSFAEGIPAMKILVLGYFFVAVNEMSAVLLFTADKQKKLIPILLGLVIVSLGLNYLFIRAGSGIEGVALATSIAYFLFFLCVFCYAFWNLMPMGKVLRMVGEICLLFLYFAIAAIGIDRWVHGGSFLFDQFLKCAIFLVALIPMLKRLEKKEKILGLMQKMMGGKPA